MNKGRYGQLTLIPMAAEAAFPYLEVIGGAVLSGAGLMFGRYVIPQNQYSSCVSSLIANGINSTDATIQCQGKATAPWYQSLIIPACVVIGGIIAVPPVIEALRERIEKKIAPKK